MAAATCSPLSLSRCSPPLHKSFLTFRPLPSSKFILQSPKPSSFKILASSSPISSKTGKGDLLSSVLDSAVVLAASIAISIGIFVADVGPASAFVVTPPRKLQTDELATVRLFQENTPSVVYITNLAVR